VVLGMPVTPAGQSKPDTDMPPAYLRPPLDELPIVAGGAAGASGSWGTFI